MEKDNLHSRNIKEFTPEDTIYLRVKTKDNAYFFLCQFISFDIKRQVIKGKAIEGMTNPSMYKYKIEQGWDIECKLTDAALYGKNPDGSNKYGFYHHFNSLGYALDPLEEFKIIENEMHVSKHPSFAVISGSRRSSSGVSPLFGSSIQHSQTITISISTAEHNRGGSYDHIHSNKQLIEVELSQTQFAEFITSMNSGDGTPCTLRYINYDRVPDPPYKSRADIFHEEFAAQMHNLTIEIRKIVKDTLEILTTKSTLNKGDKELIIKGIEKLSTEIGSNVPYMQTLFREQMNKISLQAKNEVELFIESKIRSTGIAALNDPNIIQLLKDGAGFSNNEIEKE